MKKLTIPAIIAFYVVLIIVVAASCTHVTKINAEKKELKAIVRTILETPNLR